MTRYRDRQQGKSAAGVFRKLGGTAERYGRAPAPSAWRALPVALSLLTPMGIAQGQNNIAVGGFHSITVADPFAAKDALEVSASPVSVADIAGARIAASVACTGDEESGTSLVFSLTLSGASLDVETTGTVSGYGSMLGSTGTVTQNHYATVRVRADDQETSTFQPTVDDLHHLTIRRAPREAEAVRTLLVGTFSAGHAINLRFDLTEPALRNLIRGCASIGEPAYQRNLESQRKMQAEMAAMQAKVDAEQRASAEEEAGQKKQIDDLNASIERFTTLLGKGPLPAEALVHPVSWSGGAVPADRQKAVVLVTTRDVDVVGKTKDEQWFGKPDTSHFVGRLAAGTSFELDLDNIAPVSVRDGYLHGSVYYSARSCSPPVALHGFSGWMRLDALAFNTQAQDWARHGRCNPPDLAPTAGAGYSNITPMPVAPLAGTGAYEESGEHLVWMGHDNGDDITYADAAGYCAGLHTAGLPGWRLPTIAELKTLFTPTSTRATVPLTKGNDRVEDGHRWHLKAGDTWQVHIKAPYVLSAPAVWSSDRGASDSENEMLVFLDGNLSSAQSSHRVAYRALCVTFGK